MNNNQDKTTHSPLLEGAGVRRIIGIGETILDIVFKDNQPISAVPGGSTFNAIISLGRCGVEAMLLTEVGNDRVGRYVLDFMRENGVNADYAVTPNGCKTPVSLAFLNEANDAEYAFYRTPASGSTDYNYPEIHEDDIILFGSYYAIKPEVRPQVADFLRYAKQHGAIIYYDVNFRPSHAQEKVKLAPNIMENLEFADIVRGSSEDFSLLYGMDNADKVYRAEISFYTKNFIYTDSSNPVVAFGQNAIRTEVATPVVDVVSTIGAGDNFNAGFLFALVKMGITHADLEAGLTASQWEQLLSTAQQFAADCCKSIYNYVSNDFAKTQTL